MVALTPAVLLPPATLTALRPLAPPTAPVRALPPAKVNVPVLAVLVVSAPMSFVFGERLIVPLPAKFVAVMLVEPLLKLSAPVPLTVVMVPNRLPLKFTAVPLLPPLMLRKKGPPGLVMPRAPNTFELLLNTILDWLEVSVETALSRALVTVPPLELLVKTSVCGPPIVPTIKVPPPPWPVMETPLVTPVALSAVGVAPLMTCWAKLAGYQAAKAVRNTAERFVTRMGIALIHYGFGIARQTNACTRQPAPEGIPHVSLAVRACCGWSIATVVTGQ